MFQFFQFGIKNNMLMHMHILDACFYSQGCVVYPSKHIKMNNHCLNNFFGILCQPEYGAKAVWC